MDFNIRFNLYLILQVVNTHILKYRYHFLILLFCFVSCKTHDEQEYVNPEIKNISEYVYASLEVIPSTSFICRSPKTGLIQKIHIEEGDVVSKGQLLFTIKHTADLKNRLDNAELNLKDAKDDLVGSVNTLQNIEMQIERVREKYKLDSVNYERKLRLWKQGIGSKNDLDQSALNFKNSKSLVENEVVKYNQTKTSLESKYELAESRLTLEKELIQDFQIKSEIDGTVFKVLKEKGELITPQEVFAELGNTNSFIVSMSIDEVDISKVELGDTVLIKLEAYPDDVYTSRISTISNYKNDITQTFTVEASFITKPKKLYNGLSGEANILVDKRNDALVIPSSYLVDNDKVLTEEGLLTVKLGVKKLEYVEIIAGVDSTTRLLKPETE